MSVKSSKQKRQIEKKTAVNEKSKEVILNPQAWPKGIVINHFLNMNIIKRVLRKFSEHMINKE